jgi:DNA-binding XRE family transcriptional regulator
MDLGDDMKIYGMETNQVILKEIGHRIQMRRISLSMTQKELATEASVSLRTIVNVENGENVSLFHLISILRSIRVIENIDLLLPDIKSSPMDLLLIGHPRKRVSKKSEKKTTHWKWGDEK